MLANLFQFGRQVHFGGGGDDSRNSFKLVVAIHHERIVCVCYGLLGVYERWAVRAASGYWSLDRQDLLIVDVRPVYRPVMDYLLHNRRSTSVDILYLEVKCSRQHHILSLFFTEFRLSYPQLILPMLN
jgi:hypothetical protein